VESLLVCFQFVHNDVFPLWEGGKVKGKVRNFVNVARAARVKVWGCAGVPEKILIPAFTLTLSPIVLGGSSG